MSLSANHLNKLKYQKHFFLKQQIIEIKMTYQKAMEKFKSNIITRNKSDISNISTRREMHQFYQLSSFNNI